MSASRRVDYYRARATDPAAYPAYARLGIALLDRYRETGDERTYDEAVASLQQSLSVQRNFAALLGMARALSERHRFRDALPFAIEAREAMPGSEEALGELFDIQLALGNTEAAEELLPEMPTPGFVAFSRIAAFAEQNGQYRGALTYMLDGAAAEAKKRGLPSEVQAWCLVRAGALSMFLADAAAARRHYTNALQLTPGYFFAQEHLGEWHAAHGEWKEAASIYRTLLKQHPEPDYKYALAECLSALGKSSEANRLTEEAIGELRKSVASGANDHLRALAVMLLCERRNAAEALELARRDHELRNDPHARDTLAWALSEAGRTNDALEIASPLLAAHRKDPVILLHGALIHSRAGNRSESARLVEQAKRYQLAFTAFERKGLRLLATPAPPPL